MILTLTIKKVYFDAILYGEKTSEFRQDSPFYQRRFQDNFKYLLLHYQKDPRILIKIDKIQKIDNHLKHLDLFFLRTEKIFEIKLKGPPILFMASAPPLFLDKYTKM